MCPFLGAPLKLPRTNNAQLRGGASNQPTNQVIGTIDSLLKVAVMNMVSKNQNNQQEEKERLEEKKQRRLDRQHSQMMNMMMMTMMKDIAF